MPNDVKEQAENPVNNKKRINCSECEYNLFKKSEDMATPIAGLGFRILITLFSVLMLGLSVKSTDTTFLFTVILFIIPLLREYHGFKANSSFRRFCQNAEKIFLWVMLAICFLGISPICKIAISSENTVIKIVENYPVCQWVNINYIWFWYGSLVSFFFTLFDWVVYKPSSEMLEPNVQMSVSK